MRTVSCGTDTVREIGAVPAVGIDRDDRVGIRRTEVRERHGLVGGRVRRGQTRAVPRRRRSRGPRGVAPRRPRGGEGSAACAHETGEGAGHERDDHEEEDRRGGARAVSARSCGHPPTTPAPARTRPPPHDDREQPRENSDDHAQPDEHSRVVPGDTDACGNAYALVQLNASCARARGRPRSRAIRWPRSRPRSACPARRDPTGAANPCTPFATAPASLLAAASRPPLRRTRGAVSRECRREQPPAGESTRRSSR